MADEIHERAGVRKEEIWINLVDDAREDWSYGNGGVQYAPKRGFEKSARRHVDAAAQPASQEYPTKPYLRLDFAKTCPRNQAVPCGSPPAWPIRRGRVARHGKSRRNS
jgi:hypothetical protein